MTAERYAALSAPFREHPVRVRALRGINRALTLLCYVLYPGLLIALAWQRDGRFLHALLTPAVSFAVVTVFRRWANCPRPYEVLEIQPLIPKDTKGNSFPSRHVFSVFVIAMTWLYVVPSVGIALLGCGVLLAVIRVVGGVHFPRDVIAGAAMGVVAGIVGYVIIA